MTPSPTLKPEMRMDNDISPMKPLSSPTEHRRSFSYERSGEQQQQQGPPKQKEAEQREIEQQDEKEAKQQEEETLQPATAAPVPKPSSQPAFPLRTTSLDPPEPSPSIRPSTAPAPQSTFSTTHPSLPTNLEEAESQAQPDEPPFVPLTRQPIPLRVNLIPRITASQVHCYTQHRTNVWSNNVFQPMGCMICHSNEKDRKFSCTWCQLRICRGCSAELMTVPGRDLGALLAAREEQKDGPRVLVEDVDLEEELYRDGGEQHEEVEEEEAERGRSMTKVDSRDRAELVTPRE